MIRFERYRNSKNKKRIKEIYEKSFPTEEKLPFWLLKSSSNKCRANLDCILRDDVPIGMQFIVDLKDNIKYLMYFAIDEDYRDRGFGSKVLRQLVNSYDNILLSIERPKDELSKRRKEFYIRNGFYSTNLYYEDNNVEYEILTTLKGYKPNVSILKLRYKNLGTSYFAKKAISKKFVVAYIKFID